MANQPLAKARGFLLAERSNENGTVLGTVARGLFVEILVAAPFARRTRH